MCLASKAPDGIPANRPHRRLIAMTGLHQQRAMKFTDDQITQLEQVVQAALTGVNLQLQNGEKRMDGFGLDIAGLALKQETNNVKTDAMYETFDTAKKGLVLLGTIGGGLKWVAGIVAAVAATWAVMKGKGPTP